MVTKIVCTKCNQKVAMLPTGFRSFGEDQRYKCPQCHYPIKKDSNLFLILVIIFMLLMIGFSFNVMAYDVTATVNYNQQVGQIRSDFYGVAQPYQLGNYSISLDQDCTRETESNLTLARLRFNEANLVNMRQDGALTDVGSNYLMTYTTTSKSNAELIKYAYENNLTYTMITNDMPSWLANTTSGYCTVSNRCTPTNYTKWGLVVLAAINNYTQNGLYASALQIEVWNEPQISSWLNNLSTDNIIKSIEYNKLYNATYWAVKSQYPNMKVLGLGGADASNLVGSGMQNISHQNITRYWFANFTNQADGYSIHYYYGTKAGGQGIINLTYSINEYKALCNSYGNTYCNNVYVTEWNTYIFSPSMAFSVNQSIGTSEGYTILLNNNVSQSVSFKFATPYMNLSCENTANYSMWFQQTDTKQPNYNITKMFATNHKANNWVVNATTNDSTIKIVSSYDSAGKKYITITNTNSFGANVTLSGVTTNYRDYSSLTQYNVNDQNRITVSDIPSYGVVTLYSLSSVGLGSTCDTTTNNFYQVILIFSALAIIGVVCFVMFKDGFDDFDMQKLIILFVAIIVGVILFQISAQNLAIGNCG